MRKYAAILLLLFCFSPFVSGQKTRYGQTQAKPNPSDYPINVHFSATHIRNICFQPGDRVSCDIELYADAVLNGKKLELSGVMVTFQKARVLVVPGDYPAKLLIDIHNSDSTLFIQEYDLLLPDNIVWKCSTTGVSE
jgi:hypothetical protein